MLSAQFACGSVRLRFDRRTLEFNVRVQQNAASDYENRMRPVRILLERLVALAVIGRFPSMGVD